MKVLIHSNAPWVATGYGVQCNLLARQLQAAGHEVAVSAFYGLQGTGMEWEGVTVYPSLVDGYGNDILVSHAAHFFGGDPKAGAVITLVDAWILNPQVMRQLHVASWTPVDHDPVPPKVLGALEQGGMLPVAMTRHGQQALTDAGLKDVRYAPHSFDPGECRPMDRTMARDTLGLPHDAFVVGMVAANKGNPSRKGFSEAFQAFAGLLGKHPDSLLYLHTEATGMFDGVHLPSLLKACGVPPESVRFCDQYRCVVLGAPSQHMRATLNAFDVLLNPAHGEGFGVPVLEAQACGTPVIVQDSTAMREIGDTGWQVGGQRTWTQQNSWQQVASIKELQWALTEAHAHAPMMREQAVRFAAPYEAGRVFAEHWAPIIQELRDRVEGTGPEAPVIALHPPAGEVAA